MYLYTLKNKTNRRNFILNNISLLNRQSPKYSISCMSSLGMTYFTDRTQISGSFPRILENVLNV